MERQNPDSRVIAMIDRDPVDQAIQDLRTSLTAAYAHAQLMQRRHRRGVPSSPQQVDRAAGVIARSCSDMIQRLVDLEDSWRPK
jgi:hypothetical protein